MRSRSFLIRLIWICIFSGHSINAQTNQSSTGPTLDTVLADIERWMDPKIDPCVDFYQFACGGYLKTAKIPDTKSVVGNFYDIDDVLMVQLKEVLEKPDQSDDPKSAKLAKQYYRSCMDTGALEKQGIDPMKNAIAKFGISPALDLWNATDYNWMIADATLFSWIRQSAVIDFRVSPDFKNSTRKLLHIDQPGLMLGNREFYLNGNYSNILDAYRNFMLATALQLGANESAATKDVQDIVNLEIALANISMRDEDRRDLSKMYHPMTPKELQTVFPELPFSKLQQFMNSNGISMTETDIVNLVAPAYFKQLDKVLSSHSPKTVANFQNWRLMWELIDYLPLSKRDHYLQFSKVYQGVSELEPRWKECASDARKVLLWPVAALYVKSFFTDSDKEQMDHLVINLRKAMQTTIENATWMDDETKIKSKEKLETMIQKIAYPKYIHDDAKMLAEFDGVALKVDGYMDNFLTIRHATEMYELKELRKPNDRSEWSNEPYASPAVVNAAYNPLTNDITFPAAILQYPMFASKAPPFMNYARIGMVIGHEITHGYDDQGAQFDKQGNLISWWTNETLAEFKKRTGCFINQYSKFKHPQVNMYLNGENTVGENIADNGAVKLTYKAYQSAKAEQKGDMQLPSIGNYTDDQMFFLAVGQTWCSSTRNEKLIAQIVSDVHSPEYARVNVPLTNNKMFAEAFNCPVGSQMNPAEKCDLW